MRIKVTERAIRLFEKNKEILYTSVITVAVLMSVFTILHLKDGMNILQNTASLVFLAGLTTFNCICACAIYKMKAEKDYLIPLATSFFLVAVTALVTTMVYFIAGILSGGIPNTSCSLSTGLIALGASMFAAGIMSIYVFSVMTEQKIHLKG